MKKTYLQPIITTDELITSFIANSGLKAIKPSDDSDYADTDEDGELIMESKFRNAFSSSFADTD